MFDCGWGSAAVAHRIAALCDRVAASRLNVRGSNSGSQYSWVLPDRGGAESWGGKEGAGKIEEEEEEVKGRGRRGCEWRGQRKRRKRSRRN